MTETEKILQEEYYSIKTETVEELRKVVDSIKKQQSVGNKDAELLLEIKKLEVELRNLKRTKRYGLVWEEKPEEFEEISKNSLPVLEELSELVISDSSDKSNNVIIEGDNYHSLAALSYTHKGKVDLIYIDPPYNTGNKDFVYNDHYVDKEDDFRHSKWLSFMAKRLKIARDLLKDDGAIFISIDDNEFAQLKMLCDEIFGENNFVDCIAWDKKSSAKGVPPKNMIINVHEYIMVYQKTSDFSFLGEPRTLDGFSNPDNDPRGPWRNTNIKSTTKSKDAGFAIVDPKTGNSYTDAWAFSSEELKRLIEEEYLIFPKSADGQVRRKEFFNEFKNQNIPVKSSWGLFDNQTNTEMIKGIFGDVVFLNPKPINLMKYLIQVSTKKDSLILDFFAGSGTTGHAVLALNLEDNGTRRFIICSNRENNSENPDKNLCREVCYERIKRVSKGYVSAKGENIDGLGGNIRYFKTGFVKHVKSTDNLRHAFVDRCSDLLRIKDDCFETVDGFDSNSIFRVFSGKNKSLAILFDPSRLSDLIDYLRTTSGKVSAYIFTIAPEPFAEELAEFSDRLIIEPIPDTILAAYRKIFRI